MSLIVTKLSRFDGFKCHRALRYENQNLYYCIIVFMKAPFIDRDYSAFCHEGATYVARYISLPTGVELLTVTFTPPCPGNSPPVIFIPGLASVIENFRETLVALTYSHTVYYLETREKSTARIKPHHRFSVAEVTSDIVCYADQLFADGAPYIMAGYSLGATAVAEAFHLLEAKPCAVVLIEPNLSFPFQWWLLKLARVARYIYGPAKPFLRWYLRTFKINLKEDNEMYLINCRILDAANPARIGAAIRDLGRYRSGEALSAINVPALVVVASKDKFHSHDEGIVIAGQIKNSCYLDMTDNRRTHSAEMANEIEKFISSPERIPVPVDLLLKETF